MDFYLCTEFRVNKSFIRRKAVKRNIFDSERKLRSKLEFHRKGKPFNNLNDSLRSFKIRQSNVSQPKQALFQLYVETNFKVYLSFKYASLVNE